MSGLELRRDLLCKEVLDHGKNLQSEKPDNYGDEDEGRYGNYPEDDHADDY
jgi:hypothetical protein